MGEITDEEFDSICLEWKDRLAHMSFLFDEARKNGYGMNGKNDCLREGLFLFTKYFSDLWD